MPNRTTTELDRLNEGLRLAGGAAAIALLTGTVFYHFTEHLSWVDAVYFSVVTLGTVGYGDIVPHTDLGKLFTAAYIIVGIGILAAFANILIRRAAVKRLGRSGRK